MKRVQSGWESLTKFVMLAVPHSPVIESTPSRLIAEFDSMVRHAVVRDYADADWVGKGNILEMNRGTNSPTFRRRVV